MYRFAVEAGSACAIVGPSGSGKTTLIAICAGLERPSEGSVVFNGVALHRVERRGARPNPQSVRSALSFRTFSCCRRSRRWKTSWCPPKSAAKIMRAAAPQICSSGSASKAVCIIIRSSFPAASSSASPIARAFMNRPKILFADEPTGNLDAETAKDIVRLDFRAQRDNRNDACARDPRSRSHPAGRPRAQPERRAGWWAIMATAKRISLDEMKDRWRTRCFRKMGMEHGIAGCAARAKAAASLHVLRHPGCCAPSSSLISFRDNLQSSIRTQSKSLLGADLAIESREPFSPEAEALIASLGGDQSRQIGFSSMAYFPASGASRLVQVRAISGKFPYYGALETEPPSAAQEFQEGPNALVDENVMLQFDARMGDRLKIGDQEFRIAGKLRKIPGETLAFSLISPRVYIPMDYLDGSSTYCKGAAWCATECISSWMLKRTSTNSCSASRRELQRLQLQADTVSRRTAAISAAMENLSRYLRLAVFIAVLLAGVGVASGVHVYAKEKTPSVAVLRCIGANPAETVMVYLDASADAHPRRLARWSASRRVLAAFCFPWRSRIFFP